MYTNIINTRSILKSKHFFGLTATGRSRMFSEKLECPASANHDEMYVERREFWFQLETKHAIRSHCNVDK